MVDELDLTDEERRIAVDLHDRGYAVMDFPDDRLDDRIGRIKTYLAPWFDANMSDTEAVKNTGVHRVQDAWLYNEDIRAIAANERVLELLGKLYGRRAFPFQTLNFPVGTQQQLHSDSIHFSSVPERFMCGVWLAMEDIHPDAGPLTYLPGSNRWPVLSNTMIGRHGSENARDYAQTPFQAAWDALVQHSNARQEIFLARKGQALIWAANLLHGGSPQRNPRLTRWSQVTHYYFEDCVYYTPAFSDEPLGRLDLRSITNVATGELEPNVYLGETIAPEPPPKTLSERVRARFDRRRGDLPPDFDPKTYYLLNPDVALSGVDPGLHYLDHGKREGRRYRRA